MKAKGKSVVWNDIPLAGGDISVTVVDDGDDDDNLGLQIVEGKRSSQVRSDVLSGLQDDGEEPKQAVADRKGEVDNEATDTRDLGLE